MKSQNRVGKPVASPRPGKRRNVAELAPGPLMNYSLSSVCPACARETYRLACKVRCPKCGFMWDCSEL